MYAFPNYYKRWFTHGPWFTIAEKTIKCQGFTLSQYPKELVYSWAQICVGGGGGGGQGDMSPPPTFLKVGDIISNVPPPPPPTHTHTLFSGWIIIRNEDPFYTCSLTLWTFFLFFLLVRKVCDVGWVPLLCVSKIEPKILSRKKKCRSV